jgi:branched-chain amino acid transport system ATP-binding protein
MLEVATAALPVRADAPDEIISIRDLHAWYGDSHVLHGINLGVRKGEVITMLGRNGAGKTTTLKAIMGIVRKRTGSVKLNGRELIGERAYKVARQGIAICPEERAIFASLSVEENLLLPPTISAGGMTVDEIYELFPNLAERRKSPGTKLSGGEQQMLAIGRILRTGSRVLMLDEPTEGLAPLIVEYIGKVIRILKQKGFTILLVEQNFRFACTVADRHFIVENGRVVHAFPNSETEANRATIEYHLGI